MATFTTVFIFFSLVFTQKLTICSSQINSSSAIKCTNRERIALSEFRKRLTDESGRLSSWTGQECCSWKGITCSNKTGHVLKLNLHNPTPFDYDRFVNSQNNEYVAYYSKSCLGGQLSPILLDLKQLQFLDLSMNNFSGSEIPKFLGSFENLKYLNLSVARFQGNVPPHIGNLSRLESLDISDFWTNRLTSDSLVWVSNLYSLRRLDLSGVHLGRAKDWLDSLNTLPFMTKLNLSNTLVSTIPPLARPSFTSLVSFDLQWNTIDSDFLPEWLFKVSSLVELRLDGNGFRGPVHEDFQNLKSLRVLSLSRNFFNGSLPGSLFDLRNLTYLDLSQNRLQGTVPNSITNLCNLRFLDLTQNGFTGRIPEFGRKRNGCFKNLEVFRVSYNSLNGPIPASLGTLLSLREFDISNNLFNGSIPSSLGHLSDLEKLDVSNNSLSGLVSELHFAKLSKLTELSMSFNNLVFNLNSNCTPPFQLKTIKLTSCNLGPLFPSWLQTQHDVVELRISRTSISDTLPDWFIKVYSRVHYLDISKNNISGLLPKFEEANRLPFRRLILNSNKFDGPLRDPLPSDVLLWDVSNNLLSGEIPFRNCTNLTLEVLILSNNRLSGQFPGFLCRIKTMMILDLANNRFTGKLPECIGEMENLSMLDLTNNTFHGEVPNSINNLPLISLHLHNNNFQGQLPSLANTMFLNVLDVGKNEFTGEIPPWIGENMQSLAFLSLQSNSFHGEVPPNLCRVPQLQLLNLARNNLTGTIPPCLGNLSAMITEQDSIEYLILDVDYGGSIPEIINGIERRYTKTMPFLTSIDLSENGITGEIPENMSGLVGLRNLNLANNGLTGRIPEKIGEMKELISLDFSMNRLSGHIPQGLSSLNFLTYLNLSYNDLSGRIPTGNQLRTLGPLAYAGNGELCGAPLLRRCPGDEVVTQDDRNDDRKDVDDDDDDDDKLFPWFYAAIGPGFLVGFLVVCGFLHFVRSWRYAIFRWVDNVADRWC